MPSLPDALFLAALAGDARADPSACGAWGYTITVDPARHPSQVAVELRLPLTGEPRISLEGALDYGGVPAFTDWITARAEANGTEVPVRAVDRGRYAVEDLPSSGALSLRYTLTLPDAPPPGAAHSMPTLDAQHLRLDGHLVFLVPVEGAAASTPAGVSLHAPAGWPVTGSLGALPLCLPSIQGARALLLLAGDYDAWPLAGVPDGQLWARGAWAGEAGARLAAKVDGLLAAQAALMGGAASSRLLVAVEPGAVGRYGGTALPSAVSLFSEAGAEPDGPLTLLGMAHELFHAWLGLAIAPRGDDLPLLTEGITQHVAFRALRDAGALPADQWAELLRVEVNQLQDNPLYGQADARRLAQIYWRTPRAPALVYQEGALLGYLLDAEIAAATGGDLGDALAQLWTEARAGRRLTEGAWSRALRRWGGAGAVRLWRQARAGQPLDLERALRAAGLTCTWVDRPVQDYGLLLLSSEGGGWTAQVQPGGAAARAGLQDGQPVRAARSAGEGPDRLALLDTDAGEIAVSPVARAVRSPASCAAAAP